MIQTNIENNKTFVTPTREILTFKNIEKKTFSTLKILKIYNTLKNIKHLRNIENIDNICVAERDADNN